MIGLKSAGGVLLVSAALLIIQTNGAEAEVTADRVVERFLEDAKTKLGVPDRLSESYFRDHLAEGVDALAKYLEQEAQKSPQLRDALAQTLRVDEILKEQPPAPAEESKTTSTSTATGPLASKTRKLFRPAMGGPSLTDALKDFETDSPHIVHAKRQVDLEALKATVEQELGRMPSRDGRLLQWAAKALVRYDESKSGSGRSAAGAAAASAPAKVPLHKTLMRLAVSVAHAGIDVMDRFYKAPDMFFKIPILGRQLDELRARGEPLYRLVNFLREAVYLAKLVSSRNQPAAEEGGVASGKTEIDNRRVARATQMMTRVGAIALRQFAYKLLKDLSPKAVSEDDAEELVSRAFYAILNKMLPSVATSASR